MKDSPRRINSRHCGGAPPQPPLPRGFTLVELLITLAIAAILLMAGVPSFQSTIVTNRLATASNGLLEGLNLAKSEAIRRNGSVRFCLNTEALTWKVSTMSGTDLRRGALPGDLTASPESLDNTSVTDHACVRFRPNGLSYGIGNALLTDGSITLNLNGKNRVVNIQTGALHVDQG